MFLRRYARTKNGKIHTYYALVDPEDGLCTAYHTPIDEVFFFAEFLGDLLTAATEQACGVGRGGVGTLAAVDHFIQPVERMLCGDAAAFLAPLGGLLVGFFLLGHRGVLCGAS